MAMWQRSDLLYLLAYGLAAAAAWEASYLGSPWQQLALVWALLEAAFFLFGKLRLAVLGRRCSELPRSDNFEEVWERFLELHQVFGIEGFLSGWFHGADPASIKIGNLEDFIAYAFFNQEVSELSERDLQRVDNFIAGVEEAWGVTFEPGRTPGLSYMSWLIEPLRVYHKPLAMYIATEAAAWLAQGLLAMMGFEYGGKQDQFNYWLKLPSEEQQQQPEASAFANASQPSDSNDAEGAEDPLTAEAEGAQAQQESCHGQRSLARRSSALGHMAELSHHLAEEVVDAAITVVGRGSAAMAAQHPHGEHAAFPLSPRAPSPLLSRPPSAAGAAPAPDGSARMAAAPGGQQGGQGQQQQQGGQGAGGSGIRRRRWEGRDSASSMGLELLDLDGHTRAASAVAASAAAASAVAASATAVAASAAHVSAVAASAVAAAAAEVWALDGPATPTSAKAGGVPIVFLHGVGFGMLPYSHFVRDVMRACPANPVVVLEVRHVALRLCWEAAAVDDVAHAVAAVLRAHGYSSACMAGHSYGSFVVSRLCQLYPEMVHSAVLMDPVCMMTCYPQLLYNFIYKPPTFKNFSSPLGVVDLARYICSRDLTIAQAFCRKFSWSELMLWPHDLPHRSLVVLSGGDDLVPGELVMSQLKLRAHPAKIMFNPDIGHGGMLIAPKWMAEVVENIRQLVAPSPESQ